MKRFFILWVTALFFSEAMSQTVMSGVYTVGKTVQYDFKSIGDALTVLDTAKWGGDITLKIASGFYDENINFNGFHAPYRLTITSIAGVADSVVFKPGRGVVAHLSNSSGLVFSHIKFDATQVAAYCVQLDAGLDNIEFNHCILQGYKSTRTGNAHSVIYNASGNGSAISDIRFIGNQILDGNYSIYMHGSSSSAKNRAILFDSNYIAGFYNYVAYFYNNKLTFTHNTIEEIPGIDDNYGITCSYLDSSLFDANRIYTHGYSITQYGLRTYYTDSATVISNNELIMYNNNRGSSRGLCIFYPNGTKVINNTVLLYGDVTTYGIYVEMGDTAYHAEIKNNIVACVGSGTNCPLYTNSITAASNFDLDYNCFWSRDMMTYEAMAITSESAHLVNFPHATHDIYQRPVFRDSTVSLALKSISGMDCPKISGVDYDINNKVRPSITTRGAYSDSVRFNILLSVNDSSMGSVYGAGEYFCLLQVKISAIPKYGYKFTSWNDGDTTNPRVVTLESDTSLIAVFDCIPFHVSDSITVCDSYSWHGNVYSASTELADTLTAINGCDSILSHHVVIYHPVHVAKTDTACETYTWNGKAYNASGDYTYKHLDGNGCTQVDTLHLTVHYNSVKNDTVDVCDRYTWHDSVFTESGVHQWHGFTVAGCDSTITLHLTINYSVDTTITDTADNSYTWHDSTYTESGTYQWKGSTIAGCDSTVTLMLVIRHVGIEVIDGNGKKVRVYPNPTDGWLTIDADNILSIEVYDNTGRRVAEYGATNRIDLSHLPMGGYILKIRMEKGSSIHHVIRN